MISGIQSQKSESSRHRSQALLHVHELHLPTDTSRRRRLLLPPQYQLYIRLFTPLALRIVCLIFQCCKRSFSLQKSDFYADLNLHSRLPSLLDKFSIGMMERQDSDEQCRLKVKDAVIHLTCVLCRGYLVDATTITDCLHSFCKTCIVRYLSKNSHCPICSKPVQRTKPLRSLRLDERLQNIVYKMVPGLHKAEMRRRRRFYSKYPGIGPSSMEDGGGVDMSSESARMIISADDDVSVSLEYHRPIAQPPAALIVAHRNRVAGDAKQSGTSQHGAAHDHFPNETMTKRRYLSCPAAVTVSHLQKFIRNKFGLSHEHKVDIFHCNEILESDLTLIDVAYIYSWKKKSPLGLSYLITLSRKCTHSKAKQAVSNAKNNMETSVETCSAKRNGNIVTKAINNKKISNLKDSKLNDEKRTPSKEPVSERKVPQPMKRSNDGKQIMGPPKGELLPKRPRMVVPSKDKVIDKVPSVSAVSGSSKSSPPKDAAGTAPPVKSCPVVKKPEAKVPEVKVPEKSVRVPVVANGNDKKSEQKPPVKCNNFRNFKESASSLLQGICAKLPVKNPNKNASLTPKVTSSTVSSQVLFKSSKSVKGKTSPINAVEDFSKEEVAKTSSKDGREKTEIVSSSTKDDQKEPVAAKATPKEKPKEKQSSKSKSSDVSLKSTEKDVSPSSSSSAKDEVSTSLTVNTNSFEDEISKQNFCADSGRGSDVSVCSSVDSDSSLVSPPISAESPPILRIVTSPQPADEGIDLKNDKDEAVEPAAKVAKLSPKLDPKLDRKQQKDNDEDKRDKIVKECQQNYDCGPLDLTTKPLNRTDSTPSTTSSSTNNNSMSSYKELKKRQSQKHKNFVYSMTNGDSGKSPLAYTHSAAASIPCPNKPLVVKITRKPLPVSNSRPPPPPQYIPNTPVFYSRSPSMHLDIPTVAMPSSCIGYNAAAQRNNHHHSHHKYKPTYK